MADDIMRPILVRAKTAQRIRGTRRYLDAYECVECRQEIICSRSDIDRYSGKCKRCSSRIHGMIKDHRYVSWSSMRTRVTNPRSPDWPDYGGRGIKCCPEWDTFAGFMAWDKFQDWKQGCSLDRINVNGDYEPSNCRWATDCEQGQNRRENKLTPGDVRAIRMLCWSGLYQKDVAKIFGVEQTMVSHVMRFKAWGNV